MCEIKTARLRLRTLTLDQLELCLTDHERLERELGLPVSRAAMAEPVPRAIGMKIAKMQQAAEENHAWYTYWLIIIDDTSFGAGLAGFKGYPDGNGEVEIGYGIDPGYRNKGYMTEAVRAMIAWAFEHPQCRCVTADRVARWNVASQKVLQKVGMQVYKETGDELFWRIGKPPGAGSEATSKAD
jgi:ribosomal-protein-alanine N-acetyltransferase